MNPGPPNPGAPRPNPPLPGGPGGGPLIWGAPTAAGAIMAGEGPPTPLTGPWRPGAAPPTPGMPIPRPAVKKNLLKPKSTPKKGV